MLAVSTEKSGVMLGGDVNRDGSDKGNPINTTGSTIGSVATTTALASDTTADDTPHTTLVDSMTSSIAMNVVDEEDAMGRLLYDLSEDGVSMVIGIFGLNANSNNDSIKDIDDWFTPCSQFTTEKTNEYNLIPVSRPPSHQEISPSQAQLDQDQDDDLFLVNETSYSQLATENDTEYNLIPVSQPPSHQEISPSQAQLDQDQDDDLFLVNEPSYPQFTTEENTEYNLIPVSQPPSHQETSPPQAQLDQDQDSDLFLVNVNNDDIQRVPSLLERSLQYNCDSESRPRPEVVTPTTDIPVAQESNLILSNNPDSGVEEMNRSQRKEAFILPKPKKTNPNLSTTTFPLLSPKSKVPTIKKRKVPTINKRKRSSDSSRPLKKRTYNHNVAFQTKNRNKNNVSSSRNNGATTTKEEKKIAPTTSVRTRSTNKSETITPIETYITFPTKKTRKKDEIWDKHFEEAQRFTLQHGHGRIPAIYEPNQGLANWAKRQRYHYRVFKKHVLDRPDNPAVAKSVKDGKPGSRWIKCLMTPQRLLKLQEINFRFYLNEDRWDTLYDQYCAWAEQNNGKVFPDKKTHPELYRWITSQRYSRTLLQKEEGKAKQPRACPASTLERIEKLKAINAFRKEEWYSKKSRTASR